MNPLVPSVTLVCDVAVLAPQLSQKSAPAADGQVSTPASVSFPESHLTSTDCPSLTDIKTEVKQPEEEEESEAESKASRPASAALGEMKTEEKPEVRTFQPQIKPIQ